MIDSIWISRSQIIIQVCWIKRSWFACHAIVIHFSTSQQYGRIFRFVEQTITYDKKKQNECFILDCCASTMIWQTNTHPHAFFCIFVRASDTFLWIARNFSISHSPKWINGLCMKRWAFNQLYCNDWLYVTFQPNWLHRSDRSGVYVWWTHFEWLA